MSAATAPAGASRSDARGPESGRPSPPKGTHQMPVLLSVNVGMPHNVPWQGKTVYTGVWKHPMAGPAMARRLNIDGDGQGDTNGHGGEQRAVLVYQIQSYQHWQQHFGRDDFGYGQFGENLTVDGLPDDEVCIGDRCRIGEAEFEVSQPRVTCYRVRIPALSPGWQESFRDLAAADAASIATAPPARTVPVWPGFRALRVTKVVPETTTVSSIYFTATDGNALPAARAGQYLTLRITGAGQPAPVRSYSLSSPPGASSYRISVKQEPHGAASSYLTGRLEPGAILDAAAPRGDFVLDAGAGPVLLISAGIGVTPVLAMLHELAAARSERDIWSLHGARGPREHPLAAEAGALLASLPHACEHVFYSAATPRSAGTARPPPDASPKTS